RGVLASLNRLVCPKSNQDAQEDDDEFADSQSPASEEAAYKTRSAGAVIRHLNLHMSAWDQQPAV
ncbi:MAG: hypothetical protein WBO47_12500, partial [Gammaproteobacteria bacterium]